MGKQDEAFDVVARRGWLSQTPEHFRLQILAACRYREIAAGESIFVAGDPPGGMYGLVAGRLGVSMSPGQAGPYLAHLARPGDWFGERAALTGKPRYVGLAALRATQVLHLPLKAIEQMTAQDPSLWRYFAWLAVTNLELAVGAVDDLFIRDDRKRFVSVLLRLGHCRNSDDAEDGPVDIEISQDDMAFLSNLARNTVGLILRKLERDGLIELRYRRVRIVDAARLRAMVAQ